MLFRDDYGILALVANENQKGRYFLKSIKKTTYSVFFSNSEFCDVEPFDVIYERYWEVYYG